MASLVIRNLDDALKEQLRQRAAAHGRSMEAEAREILASAIDAGERPTKSLASLVAEHFGPEEGVDLTPYLPERDMGREPPGFD